MYSDRLNALGERNLPTARVDVNGIVETYAAIVVKSRVRSSAPLGAAPAPSWFSDPRERYAVRYASEAVRCALWETLGRNRFARPRRRELPPTEVEARLVVSIQSNEPLAVAKVDLRDGGPVRIGVPSAVAHDGNRAAQSVPVGGPPCRCARETRAGNYRMPESRNGRVGGLGNDPSYRTDSSYPVKRTAGSPENLGSGWTCHPFR